METRISEAVTGVGTCNGDAGGFRDDCSSRPLSYRGERANNGLAPSLRLLSMPVHTGSGDREGHIVLAGGRLVAVLVRLDDQAHAGLVGAWFLEAGFGPCAQAAAPIFGDLDAAQEWIREQIGNYAATAGAARRGERAVSGKQAGDPVRAVDAPVKVVDSPNPPHRLLLGNDDDDGAMAKPSELREEFTAWETVSRSADFPKDEQDNAT